MIARYYPSNNEFRSKVDGAEVDRSFERRLKPLAASLPGFRRSPHFHSVTCVRKHTALRLDTLERKRDSSGHGNDHVAVRHASASAENLDAAYRLVAAKDHN